MSSLFYGTSMSLRQLTAPAEVVELLRLRHRIYFEENDYGPVKPLRLDLTAHDLRSRLFGVFDGRTLLGGLRLVFRSEQPGALVLHTLRALVEDPAPIAAGAGLPSEEAFDLDGVSCPVAARPDVEVGRLVLRREVCATGLLLPVMIATLAAVHAAGARSYLYSCAHDRAHKFARVANPRFALDVPNAAGFASDGFVFPRPTVAALAVPADSPYFAQARLLAQELASNGQITLARADQESLHEAC